MGFSVPIITLESSNYNVLITCTATALAIVYQNISPLQDQYCPAYISLTRLGIQIPQIVHVDDVTPAGYAFNHAARMHKKGGGVGILLHDSLKCETHLRFQTKYF